MIKCGIIGCGTISETHKKSYAEIPDAELICFCDLEADKAQKLAADVPGARCFTDYRKMLEDRELDAVSVCTDHASHAQIVCDAIMAGKHVICEKALGRVPEDLENMINTAAAYPEVTASGIFQHRFNPYNIALRGLIRNGYFGKVLNVALNFACYRGADYYLKDAWRGTFAGEGGGVLINQAIHFIDQLRFLFGEAEKVCAVSGNFTHQGVIEVEDTASFVICFANGLLGTVNVSNSSAASWHNTLMINGTEVYAEFSDEKLSFIAGDCGKTDEVRGILDSAVSDGTVHGKNYYGVGHAPQLADFIEAVKMHRQSSVTLADAANSAALIHAVYASAASGNWEKVRVF